MFEVTTSAEIEVSGPMTLESLQAAIESCRDVVMGRLILLLEIHLYNLKNPTQRVVGYQVWPFPALLVRKPQSEMRIKPFLFRELGISEARNRLGALLASVCGDELEVRYECKSG